MPTRTALEPVDWTARRAPRRAAAGRAPLARTPVVLGLAVAVTVAALAAPSPAAATPASRGSIYHVEYLRARPGMADDYDRFVETVFRPLLDEMQKRGIWLEYRFFKVPLAGPAPCADYTHIFMARLASFAALDREQKEWPEVIRQFYPEESKRHELFDVELHRIREMVREEILKDFDWK